MDAEHRAQVAFHLTGKNLGAGLETLERLDLRPALFARYRDLTRLRYDYPLVLVPGGVRSLSRVVDGLLQALAPPGLEGERMRKSVLRLERGIRARVAAGANASLKEAWKAVAEQVGGSAREDLDRAFQALDVDGRLVDCDAQAPVAVVTHLWSVQQEERAKRLRAELDRLATRVGEILQSDFARTEAGTTAEALEAGFGSVHREAFDFAAMARLLKPALVGQTLPERRRARLRQVLETLQEHRARLAAGGFALHSESCAGAMAALKERLPGMVELLKAMAVAGLEIEGRYLEGEHDAFFRSFDEGSLDPQDYTRFSDCLVTLDAATMPPGEVELVLECLASGLPLKILVRSGSLLGGSPLGNGSPGLSARGARLATLALGIPEAFVLQSAASHLYQVRSGLEAGVAYGGAALFSVFAPYEGYLASAAAMHSRAFPVFVQDPTAGADLAARFSLAGNPQPEEDWPTERLEYEDAAHQAHTFELPFTFLDYATCEAGVRGHFVRVERSHWNPCQVPAAAFLESRSKDDVPSLWMIEGEDLQRVVADDRMVQAALRCREAWRALQERGGVRSSLADRAVAAERARWEEELARVREASVQTAPETGGAPVEAAPQATPAPAPAPARDPDQPYIETPRCSSCNECIRLNDRMFSYNENKQAYIKDPSAGTYRQLVEAAESCQVAIIHPGRPLDPDEPGLAGLLERASVFA